MKLETERLVLRPLRESDADDLHPIFNDPLVTHNLLLPHPFPEEKMCTWIGERIEVLENRDRFALCVVLKETGVAIGICGLVAISWEHMNAELVYWLGQSHWGRGYVTEAARRMVNFAFEELKLERISAGCFTRNTASVRVLEKLGFKHEGCARHEFLKDGGYLDVQHYGMIRKDYFTGG